MRKNVLSRAFTMVCTVSFSFGAAAATTEWKPDEGGSLDEHANWTEGLPRSGYDGVIGKSPSSSLTLNANTTYADAGMTIAAGQTAEFDLGEGRELTVGILDGIALPAVEIIPESGFYDYKNKYQGTTREVCPAEIDGETANRAAALSRLAFSALRLGGYARFDFMLDAEGGLWCLEANTLPGMTPTSLLPMAASAVGISYGELCERILNI